MTTKADIQQQLSATKGEKDFAVISSVIKSTFDGVGDDVEAQKIAIDAIVKQAVVLDKNVMKAVFDYTIQPLAGSQNMDVQKKYVDSLLDIFPTLTLKTGEDQPGTANAYRLELFVDGKPELEIHLMRESLKALGAIASWSHDGAAELMGAAKLFAVRNKKTDEYYTILEGILPEIATENPTLTCIAVKRLVDDLKLTDKLDSVITSSVNILPLLANAGEISFTNIVKYLTEAVKDKPNVRTSTLLNAGSKVVQTIAIEDSEAAKEFVRALRKLAGENPDVPAVYRDFAVTSVNPKTNREELVFCAENGKVTVTEQGSSMTTTAFKNAVSAKYAGDSDHHVYKQSVAIFADKAPAVMSTAPTLNEVFESNQYQQGKVKALAYKV